MATHWEHAIATQWEYWVTEDLNQGTLNSLGRDGWEVCSAVAFSGTSATYVDRGTEARCYVILKRPLGPSHLVLGHPPPHSSNWPSSNWPA